MSRWVHRVAVGSMVLALAGRRTLPAQAPLTAADSAILASQPLKRLVNDPLRERDLLAVRANTLATRGDGNVEYHERAVVPDLVSSGADAVEPRPCGPGTLATWHNHPWIGPDSSFGVKTPEDFCSLSQPDLRTVVADSVPFAVVSVGRAPRPIVCWWRRVQAVINRHVKFLPRFPRQWLHLSGLSGVADPTMLPRSAGP